MRTILEKLHELGKMVSEMNSYKVDPSAVEWIRGLSPRDHRRVMDLFTTIHTSGLFLVASKNPKKLDGTWGKACYNIYASQYPDLVNSIAVLPDIPFRTLLQEIDKCITETVKNVG